VVPLGDWLARLRGVPCLRGSCRTVDDGTCDFHAVAHPVFTSDEGRAEPEHGPRFSPTMICTVLRVARSSMYNRDPGEARGPAATEALAGTTTSDVGAGRRDSPRGGAHPSTARAVEGFGYAATRIAAASRRLGHC